MKRLILSGLLVFSGIALCSSQTVEVDVSKAAGSILRGNTDIKITGQFKLDTLKALVYSINESPKPIYLDLSKSTGLSTFPTCENTMYRFESANLKRIVLPESTKNIDYVAFCGNSGIETIILPQGLETIDERAFADCPNLESIYIPGSVKKIGDSAFASCQSLSSIEIGEGTKEFNFYPFMYSEHYLNQGCEDIDVPVKSIVFPSTLTEAYGINIFSSTLQTIYCYSQVPPDLQSVSLIRKLKNIYVLPSLVSIYKDAWYNYTVDGQIKPIPENMLPVINSISIIGANSIKKQLTTGYTSVITGSNASNEVNWSIEGNTSEKTLISRNGNLSVGPDENAKYIFVKATSIQDQTKTSKIEVQISSDNYTIEEIMALPISDEIVKYRITSKVESYSEYSKNLNEMIETSKVPLCLDFSCLEITDFGRMGFCENNSVVEIVLPETVCVILHDAFTGFRGLRKINFPKNLKEIEYNAFNSCDMRDIVIPNSVSFISKHSFSSNAIIHWNGWSFRFVTWAMPIHFIDELEILNISSNGILFENIREINIPGAILGNNVNGVDLTSIYCPNLETLLFPNGITYIKADLFKCPSLKSITFPNSLEIIEFPSLYDCKGLICYVQKGTYAEKWAKRYKLKTKKIR